MHKTSTLNMNNVLRFLSLARQEMVLIKQDINKINFSDFKPHDGKLSRAEDAGGTHRPISNLARTTRECLAWKW